MDPLSITASVLTVLGAAEQVSKGVSKLRALYRAPDELSMLINEISDLRAVLSQVASFANQVQDDRPDGPVARLKSYLDHANDQLEILDRLVNTELTKVHDNTSPKLHRRAWLRLKDRVRRSQKDLRNVRNNISIVLGVVTSSAVTRVEMKLFEIDAEISNHHAATSALLAQLAPTSENTAGSGTSRPGSAPDQGIEPSSRHSIARFPNNIALRQTTGLSPAAASTVNSTHTDSLRVRTKVQALGACKSWCSCLCHGSQKLGLPRALRDVIGTLFIGYSGLPVLTPPCNEKSCRRRSIPFFYLVYYFPAWLPSRAMMISAKLDFMRGPQISLTLPRVIGSYNPLWRFAADGDVGAIQKLFSLKEASPFDVNSAGTSALNFATQNHQVETCKFLIQQGADVYQNDAYGTSPIEEAWYNVFSMQASVHENNIWSVTFADEDYLDSLQFSVLHKIVLGLVSISLDVELDASTSGIDAVDSNGKTCLTWAASRKDTMVVKTLLNAGANLEIPDKVGMTALWYALDMNDNECVKLLLEHGADVHKKMSSGYSVLFYACLVGTNPTLVKLLIEMGVDVNATDNIGATALMAAIQKNHLQNALCLLNASADLEITDHQGDTALLRATLYQADSTLEELLKRRANHKVVNSEGRGLLHYLAMEGTKSAMLAVAKRQFQDLDPDARDKGGKTCRDLFERRGETNDLELKSAFEILLQSVETDVEGNGYEPDGEHSRRIEDEVLNDSEFEDALQYQS